MAIPDPDCEICGGTGMAPVEEKREGPHPPSFNRCKCVLRKDILENVERGLKGLSLVSRVGSSPLLGRQEDNLIVTAGSEFLPHLRHVGVRMPPSWVFKVVSDAELVTAWLATTAFNGGEILDPDASKVSTKFLSIPDLVVPPHLVVIRMGVKVARNQAAAEVLAEAIQVRFHEGKPTWVWEEPTNPISGGHLFHSDVYSRITATWGRVTGLESGGKVGTTTPNGAVKPVAAKSNVRKGRKTLRGGSDS